MGIFGKFGDWVTKTSNRFIRGQVDEEMDEEYEDELDQQDAESARQPLDPFGHGEGEYGGRVRYRSREDLEREQYEAQQAAQQQREAMQAQQMQQAQYAQPQYAQPQQAQYTQPQTYQQSAPNVVNFPGMQASPDGSVYAHVEYVVLLRSRNECKDVIAYIKANASVFLNMEFIASDSERQRCVDMLSGAAYTLGCALNKISPRGIYLISSPSVRVVLDPALQKVASAPEMQGFARQPQEDSYTYPPRADLQESMQAGSHTTRFQAQSAQRMPSSFGSVMAGNATGMYQPVAPAGRYAAAQQ